MSKIYIIYSKKTDKFYIGSTRNENIDIRLKAHNSSKTRSTKYGKPWILIYEEKFVNYTQARKRELFLKTGIGRQWIYNNFKYIKRRDG